MSVYDKESTYFISHEPFIAFSNHLGQTNKHEDGTPLGVATNMLI